MKKSSDLSRLLGYAGGRRVLTYLSWVLSAVSALVALVPFWYIWRILKEVLETAPDFAAAIHIVPWGWRAVGFAVLSFKENGWGGLVSQGIGTSMLQMPNIVKNPRIWLPAILTSAITGPMATCLFHLQMNDPSGGVASGMGTCGLVGQIGVYAGWVNDVATGVKAAITPMDWAGMALICFILPAVLCWLFGQMFRKMGWIGEGDLTLPQ